MKRRKKAAQPLIITKKTIAMKNIYILLFALMACVASNAQTKQAICCPDFMLISNSDRACDPKDCDQQGSTLPNGGAGGGLVACKNQAKKYMVIPNLTGFTYSWTVIGGTVAVTPANPAIITWGNVSQGAIQVIISNADGSCRDTITQKVCLLNGPTAGITYNPLLICNGAPVNFSGITSVGATSFYWNFGDGTGSNLQNPLPHVFPGPGTYTVVLTISSQVADSLGNMKDCGCTDTAQVTIVVSKLAGIDIHTDDCRKMLCTGDTVKYCTSTTGCSGLTWVVNGGTILSGQGTTCVSVVWNQPSTYPTTVSLTATCPGTCGNSAMINVPVLYPNLPIQGPNMVCPGTNATYSLPALPGTFYKWSLSGGGSIAGVDSNHNVINVAWGNTPGGIYILTCNYNNPYSGCSGTDTIGVYIKPRFTLSGPSTACVTQTSTYTANGNATGWTFTPPTGFTNTPIGLTQQQILWNVPGTYTITAFPSNPAMFCNASATVNVVVFPMPVLNPITGNDTICPNQLYNYSVTSNMTGGNFTWSFTTGTGTIAPYGANDAFASVLFTGTGPWVITVKQKVHGCEGMRTKQVYAYPAPTLPATPITACIGGQFTVTVASGMGPFTWSTSPAVSLISPQGGNTATYEVHASGSITVSNCGGVSNAVTVNATLPPTITISQTGSLCAGNLQLSAPSGVSYQWFGGSSATTQSINVSVPGIYTVQVTFAGGCKSSATYTVAPVALPVVTISTGNPLIWCNPGPPSVLFQAFTLSTGCNYQWYRNGSPVGTNTGTYTATMTGTYYVQITCGGCIATSNALTVQQISCPPDSGCVGVANPLGAIVVSGCNPKTFSVPVTGCTGGTVIWSFGDGGVASGNPVTHTYANAGVYGVVASITCNGCTFSVQSNAEVPVKANFISSVTCGINGAHTIALSNSSQTLGGWNVSSVTWTSSCGTPASGTGNTFTVNAPAGCAPVITLTITVTNTNTGQSCTDTKTVTFPFASAALTISGTSNVCKDQPYTFTNNMPGMVQYSWTVNGGSPVSQNAALTYTFSGTPVNQTVGLSVKDAYGCIYTATFPVTVFTPRTLSITPSPLVKICPDCPPTVTLTASPVTGFTNFQWYQNGVAIPLATNTTYLLCNFNASGTYYVTADDTQNNSCKSKSAPVQVVYLPKPLALIEGQSVQCVGGASPYSIYVQNSGGPNTGYTYNWTATGPGTVTFSPDNLQYYANCTVSQVGTYQFILNVTDSNGCRASDTFCVYVYLSPTLTVTAPTSMCEGTMYTMTASATPSNPGYIYQWSNGATTPSITTSQAGNYSVTVTNPQSGCTAYAFAGTIQKRPYVDLFPLGCDTLCDTVKLIPPLPLAPGQNYNGVYIIKWYVDGVYHSTGPVLNLGVLTPGAHSINIVVTSIATGCSSTSGKYDIFIKHCGDCDCNKSHFNEIILTQDHTQKILECKNKTPYELVCNKPYTLNTSFYCNDTACKPKVTYSLLLPDNTVQTGNVPVTFTPSQNGTYTLTLYGWCGSKKCDSCVIKFTVKCKPCDCAGSKWLEKTYTTEEGGVKTINCMKPESKPLTVKCNIPITINAAFSCKDTACPPKVTYSLMPPSGIPVTGTVPFTFTPNPSGIYTVTLYGWCGGTICDSCILRFKTDCPTDSNCCQYKIGVDTGKVSYNYILIPGATVATQTFSISGLGAVPITEVRANVVSYSITDNFGNECMKCVNLPFTWASVSSAGNIGAVPAKITMYGGAQVPLFNGSGAGMYQNPREVIWNNGNSFTIPNNTGVSMNFILPPPSGIDCCELRGNICVKFTFRDANCRECEVIRCFSFTVKKK